MRKLAKKASAVQTKSTTRARAQKRAPLNVSTPRRPPRRVRGAAEQQRDLDGTLERVAEEIRRVCARLGRLESESARLRTARHALEKEIDQAVTTSRETGLADRRD